MSSAPKKRINPKFLELCKARLDAIEARLDPIEKGWRYPDLWQINNDLDSMTQWTRNLPELRKRVEQLGERYARIAFAPSPGLPPMYLPTPRITPSTDLDANASPMSDDEVSRMVSCLQEDGFPIDTIYDSNERSMKLLLIGRRSFHPGRLRRAIASGLIRGGPVAQLDCLLQAILEAMSRTGISTFCVKHAAKALAEAFPQDTQWLEKRLVVIRQRLIKEGYIKRSGKSFWIRVDAMDSGRAKTAFELLERLEQAGAEPFATTDRSGKSAEESQ